MEKGLKILLTTLIMILIMIVAFGGIYVKNNIYYKNLIADFELNQDLTGYRISTFKADDSSETIYYDSEGKKIDEPPAEGDYTSEEKKTNSDEVKTEENYNKVKKILTERLKNLKISDFEVRVDEENGNLYISLPEDDNTNKTLSNLIQKGKFEIKDTDDDTELLNNSDIKKTTVMYNTTASGVNVYMNIQFTKEGTQKLKEVTKEYATVEKVKNEETENEEDNDEEIEEEKQKTITMYLDEEEILSTSFDEAIEDGIMTITMGNATTDSKTVRENLRSAQYYAMLLNNEELPLVYASESSEYINSLYSDNMYIYGALAVLGAIALISIVYLVIRFRTNGIVSSIIYIGTIALFTLFIKLTAVKVGLELLGVGVILLIVLTYINSKILSAVSKDDSKDIRKLKLKDVYIKLIDIAIILLIPAVMLSYSSYVKLSIIGMNLFWGILTIILMSVIFTRNILLAKVKKD